MSIYKSLMKNLVITFFFILGMQTAFAAGNVIDVLITENGYEHVTYNPLGTTGGVYVDANENRSIYSINGSIIIENNHVTEAVHDTVLNISLANNIYNLNYSSGSLGYIISNSGNSVLILIPDLGAGQNSTFTYDVNVTNVAPALNFTSSYSDSRIFAGLSVNITDNVQNTLNSTLYPNNCLYNINITQNAMDVNVSGTFYNFTFANLGGSDSGNALISPNNRVINWNLFAGACFNSGNLTNIYSDVNTPNEITVANVYEIVNTSIKYSYNGTFSRATVLSIDSVLDLDLKFDKYMETVLTGDNATWRVNGSVVNPTNISVNLTSVTYWVSVRDATGTGFTNPSVVENDTISGASLNMTYVANQILNNSLAPWSNAGNEWYFNSTFVSTPIVWMDMDNFIVSDGVQLTNRSISYGENVIYIKELYVATGYWLQISKNITRLANNSYNVFIQVVNLGTSPTPSDKAVQVYNFLPNTFSLTSGFVFSSSSWYNTQQANETLNDPVYNGTMFQFGIIGATNPFNSSLDSYGGAININNSWTVTFNVSGSGEFNFDDLFLTGVDPLHVEDYGSTQAVSVEGIYGFVSSKVEVIFAVFAGVIGALAIFF